MLRVGIVRSNLPRLYRLWLAPAFARRYATPPVILSRSVLPRFVSGFRSNESLDLDSDESIQSGFAYKPWRTCSLMSIARTHTRCMDTEIVIIEATEATEEPKEVMLNADAHTRCLDTENVRTQEHTEPIKKLIECEPERIIAHSTHRDGAIYKTSLTQQGIFEGDIADRNETQLEPMMYSKATELCLPDAENCVLHFEETMLQFFSVVLSKSPINTGSIQLYGYIAARDNRDGMLNYIINYRRDDPIVVQQGSVIEMTGPKRGIALDYAVLLEFDMRIKNGMQEDDDQQLIDGAIYCYEHSGAIVPSLHRISGNCGAVDIMLAVVQNGVEATIEVVILEVLSGFSLSLSSFVNLIGDYEEIQLFHGNIVQTGALRRFVVAACWSTKLLLKFEEGKVGGGWHSQQIIKFQAKKHGCASRQIKLTTAAISVKVTWSTVSDS